MVAIVCSCLWVPSSVYVADCLYEIPSFGIPSGFLFLTGLCCSSREPLRQSSHLLAWCSPGPSPCLWLLLESRLQAELQPHCLAAFGCRQMLSLVHCFVHSLATMLLCAPPGLDLCSAWTCSSSGASPTLGSFEDTGLLFISQLDKVPLLYIPQHPVSSITSLNALLSNCQL